MLSFNCISWSKIPYVKRAHLRIHFLIEIEHWHLKFKSFVCKFIDFCTEIKSPDLFVLFPLTSLVLCTKSLLKFRLYTNHSTVLYLSVKVSSLQHFQRIFKLFNQTFWLHEHVLATDCHGAAGSIWLLRTLKRGNFFEAYLITKLRNLISKKGK